MRFPPKALRSADPKLALARLTDFTDRGMARYCLSEVDAEFDEPAPLLDFYGPGDGEVEAFLLAWHRGDVFRADPGRYIWYMVCRKRAAEAEQTWLGLGPDSEDDEIESALGGYREAACFSRLLLNAFSGIWLDLAEARILP